MSTNVKNQAIKNEKVAKKEVAILDLVANDHPGSFEMLIEKYGNLVWLSLIHISEPTRPY